MALLDDVKTACRVSGNALDGEVGAYIDAAIADMKRVGINPSALRKADITGLPKVAVINYCKGMLGYDNDEAPRFMEIYRQITCDLLNSSQNIASFEQE